MAKGKSLESFAGEIGVWKQCLYDWQKQFPEFSHAIKIGRAKQHKALENMALAQAAGQLKGSPAQLIFILKNTIGWRDQPEAQDEGFEDMEFME